ncbi:MAG TPA: EVE domain-containing protein [Dehalococcoidia bacterium]
MAAESAPNYYIVVGGIDIYRKTRELGFTMHGFKSTRRKLAGGMKPGDKLIFYITGAKKLGSVVTVTSEMFEDHTPVWSSAKKPQEDYPYRVKIQPDLILDEDQFVDAQPLAMQMQYTKKWPAENWTLAFQGNIHRIPEEDYRLIRRELEAAAGVRAG